MFISVSYILKMNIEHEVLSWNFLRLLDKIFLQKLRGSFDKTYDMHYMAIAPKVISWNSPGEFTSKMSLENEQVCRKVMKLDVDGLV